MLDANFWQNKDNSKIVVKEKKLYESLINSLRSGIKKIKDLDELNNLAVEERNQEIQSEVLENTKSLRLEARKNEIRCFLSDETDSFDC